jgi:hypothetical protein
MGRQTGDLRSTTSQEHQSLQGPMERSTEWQDSSLAPWLRQPAAGRSPPGRVTSGRGRSLRRRVRGQRGAIAAAGRDGGGRGQAEVADQAREIGPL